MSRKNFNTTVDEKTIETIDRLAGMGKSKGQVIDDAVALLASRGALAGLSEGTAQRWFQQTWARLDEIPDVLRGVIEEFKAKKAPVVAGVQPEVKTESGGDAPFSPMCKHCGEKFGAWNRQASLCGDCKGKGHVASGGDCPICWHPA